MPANIHNPPTFRNKQNPVRTLFRNYAIKPGPLSFCDQCPSNTAALCLSLGRREAPKRLRATISSHARLTNDRIVAKQRTRWCCRWRGTVIEHAPHGLVPHEKHHSLSPPPPSPRIVSKLIDPRQAGSGVDHCCFRT
jgi:hypothetical protein